MVKVALKGIGYRFWKIGANRILFELGFNRFCFFHVPVTVRFYCVGKVSFGLVGSFQAVSTVVQQLKQLPHYNPYTGKGLVVDGRGVVVRLKRKKKNVV